MTKKIMIGLGLIGILVFTGCVGSQPQQQSTFNKNNKSITFINGKPYFIPRMAKYSNTQLKNIDNSYKKIGCRNGDVFWFTGIAYCDIDATLQKYKTDVIKRHYNNGEIGCAKPLSNQQYQYVLNQQNQRAANARAQTMMQNYNNQVANMQLQNTTNNIMNQVYMNNAMMRMGY